MAKRRRSSRQFPGPRRRSVDDGPTKEMIAHRAALGLTTRDQHAYPLGVLEARGYISSRQHEAGKAYAALRSARFSGGVRWVPTGLNWSALVPPTVDGEAVETREIDEARRAHVRSAYDAADNALRDVSSRAHSEVQNVACFERWPNCLVNLARGRLESGARDIQALRSGLTALADHWKLPREDERRAA